MERHWGKLYSRLSYNIEEEKCSKKENKLSAQDAKVDYDIQGFPVYWDIFVILGCLVGRWTWMSLGSVKLYKIGTHCPVITA